MHSFAIICLLAATAMGLPTQYVDIDTAICVFPILTTQNRGGNTTTMLNNVLPYLTKERILDHQTRLLLLAAGGLNTAQANKMVNTVLPTLAIEGKSVYEQLMSLMFVSDQYCTKSQGGSCHSNDDSMIPFMTMSSERGCFKEHIISNSYVSDFDECVCDDQDNVLLWISLLDKIQRASGSATNKAAFLQNVPNQIPVIMMMLLTETPCDGKIRGTPNKCQCSTVTEGNEGLLMQYIVDTPGDGEILTSTAKAKVQDYSREPSARSGFDILQFLLPGSIEHKYLPFITNNGGTSSQQMMQLLAANMGLDAATTHLLLNGGFNDDDNKISMINYLANKGLVSADAVPFILGVDKGSIFFIQSMIQSGALDPILGHLLLAKQTGASQGDVFELITQLLTGDTIDLKDIGKPFIPPLPAGIFPGSKLYFAHLESLGINTCALHDLRNRFNCGFEGIGAAQCEVLPYCCYNPVFLSNDQVTNITEGAITEASAVPWCYYNVFFIYYDSFALNVKRPGEFAGPSSCLPLFKYGLNIDASIYYQFAVSSGSSAVGGLVNFRANCGFPGITEFHCVAIRGCCWDKYAELNVPQCYKSNGAESSLYDLNNIPAAYQPKNNTCNVNYYQFPLLYHRRIACMPTWDMFVKGRDPLKMPDKYECLWELGCCWEEEESVGKKYPYTPRCYRREDGGFAVQPNNIGNLADLIARSGELFPPAGTQ